MIGVSLFSGAGGMDLGAQLAGVKTLAAVEMDPIACATFAKNFPDVTLFQGLVQSYEWSKFGQHFPGVEVDIVFGGPPCQPFSVAGKGRGQYDPRDGVPHFMHVVDTLMPRAFILENVRGLTFATHRAYLQQVCADFRALGYDVYDRVLDAASFGVPQHRERLFIVGFRAYEFSGFTFNWPMATHADPRSLQDHLFSDDLRQPWVTVRQALGLGPGRRLQRDYGGDNLDRGESQERPDHSIDEPAPTITDESAGGSHRRADFSADDPARTVIGTGTGGMVVRRMRSGLRLIHGGLLDRPSTSVMAAAQGRLPPPGHHSSIFDNAKEKRERTEEARKDQEVFDAAIDTANEILMRDQWGDQGKAHSTTYSGDRPARTLTRHPHQMRVDDPGYGRKIDDVDAPSPTVMGAPEDIHDGGARPPYLRDEQLALSNGVGRADPVDLDEPSRSILSRMYKEPKDLTRWVDAKHPPSQLDEPAKTISSGGDGHSAHDHVLDDDVLTQGRSESIQQPRSIDEPAMTVPYGNGNMYLGRNTGAQSQRLVDPDAPAPTLNSSGEGVKGERGYTSTRIAGDAQNGKHGRYRRLSVEECAKLQAFPDSFQFTGTKSARYRCVGNAVPPPLAQAVVAAVITALGAAYDKPARPDGRKDAARSRGRTRR